MMLFLHVSVYNYGFITEKMAKRKMDMSLDDIIKENKNEG